MSWMKSAVSLAGFGALVGACAAEPNEAMAPNSIEQRTTAADAVEKIAQARCSRELACEHIGETARYSTRDHCLETVRASLNDDLGNDGDCKNGVGLDDLKDCLQQTADQDCGGVGKPLDDLQRSMECGSNQLCLD